MIIHCLFNNGEGLAACHHFTTLVNSNLHSQSYCALHNLTIRSSSENEFESSIRNIQKTIRPQNITLTKKRDFAGSNRLPSEIVFKTR